jgi:hypothetical protein
MKVCRRVTRSLLAILGVGVFLPLSGCAAARVHSQLPAFANAVTLTSANVKSAFEIAQLQYVTAQSAKLAMDYDTTGFNPSKVKDLLPLEDIQARITLLKALSEYANSLAEVTDDKHLDEFDASTKALGNSLVDLSTKPQVQKLANVSQTDINITTTAIDALGHWFIERKIQKELPKRIEEMKAPIQTICDLLAKDIGNAPDSAGHGGGGLREIVWNEYRDLLKEQSAYIDHNKGTMDVRTRSQEIQKLPAIVREQRATDLVLGQTKSAISKIAETHNALELNPDRDSTLRIRISALVSEGQRVKDFYAALQKKKE